MLIFVILLHFGLKIMSVSSSTSDGKYSHATHVCADFNTLTNATTIKWAMSSPSPITISGCELFYHESGSTNPVSIVDGLPLRGSTATKPLTWMSKWIIQVTCKRITEEGQDVTEPSPELWFIPGNSTSEHVCSDSGLGRLAQIGEEPLAICVWRPEPQKDYVVVRWQPSMPGIFANCSLQVDVRGRITLRLGLPADDVQFFPFQNGSLSVWVTCHDNQGKLFNSQRAEYIEGASSVCSVEPSTAQPITVPDILEDVPTETPSHSKLGITNIAMGLSLAVSIVIATAILMAGFLRWFRWQRRRRRARLLRNGEPAADQSAMDEFQQMM